MAYFKNPTQLNDEEKEFLFEEIKPLLQKNKIKEARSVLFVWNGHSPSYSNTIRDFILQHLGEELYFQGDDTVDFGEFYKSTVSRITLPSFITGIQPSAFEECQNLEYVKIVNDEEIDVDVSSFKNTNCIIYIPKTCYVNLYGAGYLNSFEDIDCNELLKESDKLSRIHKLQQILTSRNVDYQNRSNIIRSFKLVSDNFLNKVKLY